MDRELLLEIGCEELPAGWLPGLTQQFGERLDARLAEFRLQAEGRAETFSTPRRLTARVAKLADRQTDFEELLTGPPVSAAFGPDGAPSPAAAGFARKQGVDAGQLERISTPKGEYLGFRKHIRGKATIDVLTDVCAVTLRDLSFPRLMNWDARLEDGRGDFPFGRPIRWILFLYGGRVVPFEIVRTEVARSSSLVQDVRAAAVTYGHRFLTTSGRAGRAIKVRSFDDYRGRLLENFVILDRGERHEKIARELDTHARRLSGRVSPAAAQSGLLQEVPDLVEYPSVIAGTFAAEFAQELPEEVLITTMIHHQHFFPVVDDEGRLKPAFLAVTNTQPENDRTIARNAERVLTARLRDARFFWDADRRLPLEARVDRLETILFHKKLGTYKAKAERIERLARWIASEALGAPEHADAAAKAARLAKADLVTDMVGEFPELQGTMGGIYARHDGEPEEVSRAIYYHYLPASVEASAPPSREDLGKARITWAAVSLADKLDTIVGLVAAGERPTGSRDPFGLRRAAQGVVKILADAPQLGVTRAVDLSALVHESYQNFRGSNASDAWRALGLSDFFAEREAHLFERRGFSTDEARAVAELWTHPRLALERIEAISKERSSEDFQALAGLLKRVKNITKDFRGDRSLDEVKGVLREPAELALVDELIQRWPAINEAMLQGKYVEAIRDIVAFRKPIDRFFVDVLVMADDQQLREARLTVLSRLRNGILQFADISQLAPSKES